MLSSFRHFPTLNFRNAVVRQIHAHADKGLVARVCDSLTQGFSWDELSNKFGGVEMSNSLVKSVLLELKEPSDAKSALGFFHWSATQRRDVRHSVEVYCVVVHILVRSRMMKDAQALLESVLRNGEGSVVDALVSSYRVSSSSKPAPPVLPTRRT